MFWKTGMVCLFPLELSSKFWPLRSQGLYFLVSLTYSSNFDYTVNTVPNLSVTDFPNTYHREIFLPKVIQLGFFAQGHTCHLIPNSVLGHLVLFQKEICILASAGC